MRVVMDATAAVRQRAGVGRFARGLLTGLAEIDTHNDYFLITTGRHRLTLPATSLPQRHHWVRLPVPERIARIAWERLRLLPPPASFVPGAKIFFTADFALPRLGRVPSIPTIHDLSFLTHPECADEGLRKYLSTEVPRSIHAASAVVAVSHTTARALQELLGVEPAKIAVVPNGVDAQFRPLALTDETPPMPPFGLPTGYLLSVGTLEPRKNYVRLLQAFAKVQQRAKPAQSVTWPRSKPSSGYTLVIAGREGWKFEPIFREVARLNLASSVKFMTNTSDSDLLALYQHASAMVFPSLNEGFGIPPLEAMACGIPVAASTGGALPEVLGDAALSFDAFDVDGMSAAIERIMQDEPLQCTLRERGTRRAADYTWVRAATEALQLFERVAA
ncbi:MAG: glycosyltransferase family 1 protein [Chloroflexi bacterium]|jgi:glycosyltransferase involved in cell wall biosynthesis|nr:glycosyltransferase family 1 protein [Chloroflexota bacterium]